jgi:predicted transcriptional regulator
MVFRANVATAPPVVNSYAIEITALTLASAATFTLDQEAYADLQWTASSPPPPMTVIETSEDAQATPTDLLALRATVANPAPGFENITAAARAEIEARFNGGTLETDTLNQSLASQVLRATNPAEANAINAELRFRQHADGSFDNGDIRATAEACRALAMGDARDIRAAARALDYLDGLGPLPPEQAVWRLRAHGTASLVSGTTPPPPLATGASDSAFGIGGGLSSAVGQNKAIASGIFLMGGIGLSLALVTVDALKGARRQLYDVIKGNPGLHVNELRRRLTMSPSSIEYHLSVLVGAGLVVSEEDGRYKRYYANGAGLGLNTRSPNSRNTLGALRRPHATEIVQHLMEAEGGVTAREVSRALTLHESAASRRMAHLERSGVLESQRDGRERRYQVRDRAAAMKALSLVEVPSAPATNGEPTPTMVSAEQRPSSEGAPAGATSSP